MTTRRETRPGPPILLTAEPQEHRVFYEVALGWVRAGAWMDGQARHVALIDRPSEGVGPVSGWVPTFNVPDVASTVQSTIAMGGQEVGDLARGGRRWRVLIDGEGLRFAVTGSPRACGSEADGASMGALAFLDLYSSDTLLALRLYQAGLGAESVPGVIDVDLSYDLLVTSEGPIAGVVPYQALSALPASPHWLPYFRVRDIKREVARIVDLGASVRTPFTDTPLGEFAVLVAPHGEAFGLQSPRADGLLLERAQGWPPVDHHEAQRKTP